jgi:hypothetical protein
MQFKNFSLIVLGFSALGFFISTNEARASVVHPAGTLVISQGTVYRISDNSQSLEAFDSSEKYYSYRYNFSQAVTATSADLALPKNIIQWGDGRLFLEQSVAYQVSKATKHGFVSQDAFIGQGFKFSQAKLGVLNLPVGKNIESATEAHQAGTFVIDTQGTVWRMTDTTREGVPTLAHLASWGIGFDEIVPANTNDMSKLPGALIDYRTGSLIIDQGSVSAIEGKSKRTFPSAECFTNFGYSFANLIQGSTQSYPNLGVLCGPQPSYSYERKTVATSRGNFLADIIKINLANGEVKVVTDTGNGQDCLNNCAVRSLLDYVKENQGFAGINGSYFCPSSYPECAGKTNSFYWKVYNTQSGLMINKDNGIKEDKPFMAFDSNGTVRFFNQYKDLANSGFSITAGISNEPLLIANGQVVVNENSLDEKERTVKSTRGGLGVLGQTVYAVIARSATVMDLAAVMQALGTENAFNLDGGGSSAMVYDEVYKVGPGRVLPNVLVFVKNN